MEYTFRLRFLLDAREATPDELVERLAAAGCDDAVIGTGRPGRLALEFVREGDDARDTVLGALAAVIGAIPTARLFEAGPDLVGLSDVAERVGVSRQNLRKLMLQHWRSFPAPVHDGTTAVWHLAPLLEWLRDEAGYDIDAATIDVARITLKINAAREANHLDAADRRALKGLVA